MIHSFLFRPMRVAAVAASLALGGALALPALQADAAPPAIAQKIADHFSSVKSMTGEFVQFGPRGEQTGGTFSLLRPGRIRFDYEAPAAFRVVSDGNHVLLNNEKLKTYETYPLSKTPLKLLLEDRIDLSKASIDDVKADEDIVTVKMSDASVFGNARISMVFDAASSELRQWTITDAQGKDTTVMIFNVKEGVPLKDSAFAIDYNKVAETNSRRGSGGRGR
ncbi:hypothetical protein CSC94_00415 [Zhengella mangrovi]|uniref:Cell envelope biogenesis protein LolA n=1 Tax=Zhengella mangrovi TaxID=1982044 RepID=A0A2G1QTG1_9HYPH|nr:outer membrane lipoprotein carrier protein LolA [Zhengella mangrovi]PHP68508.1 hypothetical protein CSC94_00415 [Zhengella mangrovi]